MVPDVPADTPQDNPSETPKTPVGRVQLVDSEGTIFEAGAGWVQKQIDAGTLGRRGLRLASEGEVRSYDDAEAEKRRPVLEKVVEAERAARAAGMAGAIDAATAIARAPVSAGAAILGYDDPLEQVSGRRVLENVGYLAAEAMGGSGEATARSIQREQAALAERNPLATAAGEFGGQVAGSLPSMGAAGALGVAGRVGLGAVEGAGLGASTAHEDAYLKDRKLTRDQLLASIGIGTLLGVGSAAAGEGLSLAARRLFQRSTGKGLAGAVDAVEGEAGTAAKARELPAGAAPEPEAGPLGGYRSKPADYEGQIRAVTGQEPAPGAAAALRDTIEGAQATASGTKRETLASFGALRGGPEAVEGRALWRNREEIIQRATADVTRDVDDMIAKSPDILDEVWSVKLKRSNVASRIDGNAAAQSQLAREHLAGLRSAVSEIASEAETFGKDKLPRKIVAFFDELAERTAKSGDDAAEAYIALDQAKRALQKHHKGLQSSAARLPDYGDQLRARAMAERFDELQESTRQLLMSEDTWGRAAADQRRINALSEEYLRTREMFEGSLLRRVERADYDGRPVFRANDEAIGNFMQKVGTEKGALVEEYARRHVAATKQITSAIGEAYELGAKSKLVSDVAASAGRVSDRLDHVAKTVKIANQIDAVIAAESSGGPLGSVFSGAAIGTLAGGPIGTAVGAAASILTRPGAMIRTRAAIEAMIRESDSNIAKAVAGLLEEKAAAQLPGKAAKRLTAGADDAARALPGQGGSGSGRRTAERMARIAAVDSFAAPGEDDRKAYKRRADELAEIQRDPVGTHKRVTRAIQGTADVYPDLAAETAMSALRAQAYLAAKLPVSPTERDPLTGKPASAPVTDEEIDTFKAHWEAVRNPMSVLASAAKGRLVAEQVEALKEVYPALYERIRFTVSEQLASGKHDPPYETRLQLDLLLDLNGRGESSLSPEFQRTLAMVADTPEAGPEGAPQGGGGGKVNPRMAAAYQTTSNQVEAGL